MSHEPLKTLALAAKKHGANSVQSLHNFRSAVFPASVLALLDELKAAYNVIAARDRHIDALEAELLALKTQEPIGYVSENDWSCAYLHHDNTPGNPVYAAAAEIGKGLK